MHEDFYCLDLGERTALVRKQGEFLLTTDFYGASVKLFYFNTCYVEMYHHPVTNRVMRVSIASPEDLEKHLSGIRIAC